VSKVLVTIPYYESIEPPVMAAVTQIALNAKTFPVFVKARPADHARNLCVQLLMKNTQFTHIMMVDSDTEPTGDAMERMLSLNVDVACGVYKLIMPEGQRWAVMDKRDDGKYYLQKKLTDEKHPFYADAAGAGIMLIRRGVFESMARPWFQFIEHEDFTQETEDVFFFKKCNAMGIRPRIDPLVRCIHHKLIGLQ
jgi:hypothetical protein